MRRSKTKCPSCEGHGYVVCDMCNGHGELFIKWRPNPDGSENDLEVWEECPKCFAEKAVDCTVCKGTGLVSEGSYHAA